MALALAGAACDTTAPANSRGQKAEAELAAYFGKSGAGGMGNANASGNVGGSAAAAVAGPTQNDPTMDWADPCAQNLDELVSALLLYYGQHRALPPSLDAMPKTSITGQPISLTCPNSGRRYEYYPSGLKAPMEFTYQRADGAYQEGSRLVLYDAVPVHQVGQRGAEGGGAKRTVRLAIVMEQPRPTPTVPNPSLQLYIVPLEQGILDMYLKANQTQ
jgi:hypothetical protein